MIKRAGLIGHPLNHSKSPIIHGYWIKKYGLSASYELLDTQPGHLKQKIEELVDQGFCGFNVTIPFKEEIIPICHQLTPVAKAIGAVNTVHINGDVLTGTNTDMEGFLRNVNEGGGAFALKGKAMVLGAGGAARAIIYGLAQEGSKDIIITNRTLEKAEDIRRDFSFAPIRVMDWEEKNRALEGVDILINTTSLGMKGAGSLDIDIARLPKTAIVHDIVYNPLYTDLLLKAREQGLKTITGIGMLLYQAAPAFEWWFSVKPDVTPELEELVLK